MLRRAALLLKRGASPLNTDPTLASVIAFMEKQEKAKTAAAPPAAGREAKKSKSKAPAVAVEEEAKPATRRPKATDVVGTKKKNTTAAGDVAPDTSALTAQLAALFNTPTPTTSPPVDELPVVSKKGSTRSKAAPSASSAKAESETADTTEVPPASSPRDAAQLDGTTQAASFLRPDVLRLLQNEKVIDFLSRIANGEDVAVATPPASSGAEAAATPTSVTPPLTPAAPVPPPDDVKASQAEAAAAEALLSAAPPPPPPPPPFTAVPSGDAQQGSWPAHIAVAVNNGMSPWTAPFRFKPPFNVRGGCSFAAHHRRLLEAQFGPGTNPTDFPVRWVSDLVARSFNALNDPTVTAPVPSLAMPPYGVLHTAIGGTRVADTTTMKELAYRRTFQPLSRYTEESQKTMTAHDPPLSARCGETGKFFSREELTDALLHHSSVKQYRSPFWITSAHPRLVSGYLDLKPESKPVIVANVALVFDGARIDAVPSGTEGRSFLHPNWLDKSKRQPGMNAFTGQVSNVPRLRAFANGWASLEQLIDARLQIPYDQPSRSGEFSLNEGDLDGGVFVELREFALYNADQLEKPGRLAVIRDEDIKKDELFQPFHN